MHCLHSPLRVDPSTPVTVLSGATGGIGSPLARRFAEAGHALVLLCRTPRRAETLCTELEDATGATVRWVACDFSSLASVRQAASRLRTFLPRLDRLVNNAGRYGTGYEETPDGFESHLAVNHLAPFLLTHLLLPLVRRTPGARIVNVAGETARFAHIDLADLNRRQGHTVPGAYGQSKLAMLLFSRVLARSLEGTGVLVNAMQPGAAATEHLAAGPAWLDALWRAICPPPEVAANAVFTVATGQRGAETHGQYFLGTFRAPPPCQVRRAGLAEALYARSAMMVGLEAREWLVSPDGTRRVTAPTNAEDGDRSPYRAHTSMVVDPATGS